MCKNKGLAPQPELGSQEPGGTTRYQNVWSLFCICGKTLPGEQHAYMMRLHNKGCKKPSPYDKKLYHGIWIRTWIIVRM